MGQIRKLRLRASDSTNQRRWDGEKYIFAKGFTPAEQIAAYLATLDLETLKEGVPIAQLANNISFKQENWTTEVFHTAIGAYLDKNKYVTLRIMVDGKTETYIFAKGFTPAEQIERFLATLNLENTEGGSANCTTC